MSRLATLQHGFLQQVLRGELEATHAHTAAPYSDVSGPMAIYIHAYQARMRQALASNFPVLQRAMGDVDFAALARAFCTAQPSQHRSIRWLGDRLSAFLAAEPALLAHPALLDIARMDWAMRAVFDAADSAPLALHDLGRVAASDWPALRLHALPSLQLLELQWGVAALWHALHADASSQTAEPLYAPHAMVIWRAQLQCRWRTLDATELLALRLVQKQVCFAELCAGLQQAGIAQPAQKAAELLQTWLSEGLLARH
jgi:hypothetical protein